MTRYEDSSTDKLMLDICKGFGLEVEEADRQELFGLIMEYFVDQYKEGKNNLIIVDNAENISDESLQMLNKFMEIEIEKCKLVQVIISGCPELHDRLKHIGGDLGPKFTFTVELAPLNLHDTVEYVEHRIKTAIGDDDQHLFKNNSYTEIYNYSKGIPSEINRIAQKALAIAKEGKQAKITSSHIKMAAARLYGVKVSRRSGGKGMIMIALIVVVIGAGLFYRDTIISFFDNQVTDIFSVVMVQKKSSEADAPAAENTPEVSESDSSGSVVQETIPEQPVTDQQESVQTEKSAADNELAQQKLQSENPSAASEPEEKIEPEPQADNSKAEPEHITASTSEDDAAIDTELEEAQPEEPAFQHGCITANSGLKIRSGPSVNTELLGTAPSEAYIELYELSEDGNWWKTKYQGRFGYMYAKYIKIVETPDQCAN
jgi:general secretion pathway protein A